MARKFIQVREAAAKIGKSTTTLFNLRKAGLFPDPTTNIPGGRPGYYEDDVQQWDAAEDKRAVTAEINARYHTPRQEKTEKIALMVERDGRWIIEECEVIEGVACSKCGVVPPASMNIIKTEYAHRGVIDYSKYIRRRVRPIELF